jgi:pilus assembly protein Flp/PilA
MWRCCSKRCDLLKRVVTDEGGIVSFEYVVVAACLVAAVVAAFGTNASGVFATGLTNVLNAIGAAINAAVGG